MMHGIQEYIRSIKLKLTLMVSQVSPCSVSSVPGVSRVWPVPGVFSAGVSSVSQGISMSLVSGASLWCTARGRS